MHLSSGMTADGRKRWKSRMIRCAACMLTSGRARSRISRRLFDVKRTAAFHLTMEDGCPIYLTFFKTKSCPKGQLLLYLLSAPMMILTIRLIAAAIA